jgi:NADH-quinone oxidoreductase subunit A
VDGYLGSYASVALLLLVGVLIVGGAFSANRLLRPSRPIVGPGKYETYECGIVESPAVGPGLGVVDAGWAQSQIRYYVYAYLYVLFAVEAVFLFPWAVVYASAGPHVLIEMAVFVAVLALGLLYAWRKKALTWQ